MCVKMFYMYTIFLPLISRDLRIIYDVTGNANIFETTNTTSTDLHFNRYQWIVQHFKRCFVYGRL